MTDWIYIGNSVGFEFDTICSANYWLELMEEAELSIKLAVHKSDGTLWGKYNIIIHLV